MDWRTKRDVIASLLRANRPDLAQCVADFGYWEKHARSLQSDAADLRRTTLFHAEQIKRAQGSSSRLYRTVLEAVEALDRFSSLIDVIKHGVKEGVVPMTPGRRPALRPAA